jgi:16S rRNA processing protein RimM
MSDLSKSEKNLVPMGRIGAAHGIKGSVRVKSFTANALDLGKYGALQDKDSNKYTIKNIRPQKTMTIVRFNEVSTREQAEKLNGVELFIEREKLPNNLEKEEFYIQDLVGMDVFNMSDKFIGTIIDMPNFGAGDLVEISPLKDDGSFDEEFYYLAFTKANVPTIDFKKHFIKINPPIEISENDIKVDDEQSKK